jgi:uncharacterized membrane protein
MQRKKNYINLILFLMVIYCVCLSIIRYIITDTRIFLFLNWNLFLAIIPFIISSYLIHKKIQNKSIILLMISAWILFFPNAPYILTDLFHLKNRGSAPIWFDLILILTFVWTGMTFGFMSLRHIEILIKPFTTPFQKNIVIILFLFLSSFGIYLGRFLRWNSWHIINKPILIFNDISDRVISPTEHPRTWGVTILMGMLLNIIYFSIKMIRIEPKN